MMTLAEILKDSDYKQAQFDIMLIHEFEQKIVIRTDNDRLTPEETVRQLYLETK
jgi:hypothetical protein